MGLSSRLFLVDENDDLYRLPNSKFEQMLRGSTSHRFPRFAGSRVRMCGVVVELVDRQPIRVVWTTYSILTFDGDGGFDPDAFERHQRARAELALAPLTTESERTETVIDAAIRFVDQGGRWEPSRELARHIDKAALEQVKCPRL